MATEKIEQAVKVAAAVGDESLHWLCKYATDPDLHEVPQNYSELHNLTVRFANPPRLQICLDSDEN